MGEDTEYPHLGLGGQEAAEGDYDQWCSDHWDEVKEVLGQRALVGVMAVQDTLLADDKFYEIAYRLRNGYAPPGPVSEIEVPENERPHEIHLNQTMEELAPLCCWLADEREKWDLVLEKARGETPMVCQGDEE